MSNRYAKFLVASLAALVFVATAERGWAGSYNDAMTLYYKGDFAGAAQALRALAERGDATAQRELGRMYVKGEGVPKDEEEAKKLFKMANEQSDALKAYNQGDFVTAMRVFRPLAEKGQPLAEYILGLMYANAQGVPENYPEALTWLQKAGEQGESKAQFAVGVIHFKGLGMPRNYAEAFKWYRRAADHGLAVAQYNLGAMYAKGQAGTQDVVTAHMLYSLAAGFGIKPASIARDQLAKTMTAEQIAQAEKMAKDWKPKPEVN
jgi:TPR repeat protein